MYAREISINKIYLNYLLLTPETRIASFSLFFRSFGFPFLTLAIQVLRLPGSPRPTWDALAISDTHLYLFHIVRCTNRYSGFSSRLPPSRRNKSFQIICLCRLPYTLRVYVWCRKGRFFYEFWQDVKNGWLHSNALILLTDLV